MTTITDRIERDLGIPGLAATLADRLEPADLQSLLLDVYRRIASRRQASAMLADFETNRFVRPSAIAPRRYVEWDDLAFSQLPAGFQALELSPVCPLGASCSMAGLTQDWALSTVRNTEVLSDSTNVLALEAASRRRALKHAEPRSTTPVHLAASHRLLRTRRYGDPRLSAHFRVFSLCSAGRDEGAVAFEAECLRLHIEFYLSAVRAHLGPAVSLRALITVLDSSTSTAAAAESLVARLQRDMPDVDAALHPERSAGRQYYRTLCFWIYASHHSGEAVQLVDGGCVDWTQRLLSDAKERLVVSGVGTDRVCAMRAELRNSQSSVPGEP